MIPDEVIEFAHRNMAITVLSFCATVLILAMIAALCFIRARELHRMDRDVLMRSAKECHVSREDAWRNGRKS